MGTEGMWEGAAPSLLRAGAPREEVPTLQRRIGESRLAPCHHPPAPLIHQEPDTCRIRAKLGEGPHSASPTPSHPFCCLRVINRVIKNRMS